MVVCIFVESDASVVPKLDARGTEHMTMLDGLQILNTVAVGLVPATVTPTVFVTKVNKRIGLGL